MQLDAARRRWLSRSLALTGLLLYRSARATPLAAQTRLAAAWDDTEGRHWLGVLTLQGEQVEIAHRLALPTRAHGLVVEADGAVLAIARRPGEWLLRWQPQSTRKPQWLWAEADRCFNGHALRDASGQWLYTVESDQAQGNSLLVRRRAADFTPVDEWPTGGLDAHQLLWDAEGHILLANGGVLTLPETGRRKLALDEMDSSLVRLHRDSGALLGQWRLPDPRLSLRHLARHADGRVGIALQAQHTEAQARAQAPLLALFDGERLHTAQPQAMLQGYGGDIAALTEGFVVSAPRAGGLGRWALDGRWLGFEPLEEACAVTTMAAASEVGGETLFAGGAQAAAMRTAQATRLCPTRGIRLDNHWQHLG